ncbi:efflux RND transporter periplasmic adaptor subunit [Alphaproteobacteria bacterium]|jgi:RND family efflux transporter MFP subunit|nr:efflux RND transporter periplasmic adaptor subunit [Alphaproteobacteria bacterium]
MKLYISILTFMCLFFASPLHAQSKFKDKSKRASLVEIEKVKVVKVSEKTNAIGRLVALDPIIVSSKINQEILKVHFKIGDDVKKNDLLFTLASKDIIRNIKQINAELKLEEKTLNLLKEQLSLRDSKAKNAKNLKERKIITQDNLDNVNISLLQNKQQIAQREYNIIKLKISLDENKENLTFAKILSPVDGNIISIQAQTGALISKGKILASILANGLNEIETDLRSELASQIIIGSEVNIINDKTNYKGKVRGIVNSENIRTGTRKVRITLNESLPKSLSASGTRFSLEISIGKSLPRLLIPKDALISRGNKQIVYCFEKGLAKQKLVKIGISVGNKIEILGGLEEGQLVVVKGNENLRPNQSIKIKIHKQNKKK